MFNFSLAELLLIFIVALLVFGPKQLPHLAKNLGRLLGKTRRTFQEVISSAQKSDQPKNNSTKSSHE